MFRQRRDDHIEPLRTFACFLMALLLLGTGSATQAAGVVFCDLDPPSSEDPGGEAPFTLGLFDDSTSFLTKAVDEEECEAMEFN